MNTDTLSALTAYEKALKAFEKFRDEEEDLIAEIDADIIEAQMKIRAFNQRTERVFRALEDAAQKLQAQLPPAEGDDWARLREALVSCRLDLDEIDDRLGSAFSSAPSLDEIEEIGAGPLPDSLDAPSTADLREVFHVLDGIEAAEPSDSEIAEQIAVKLEDEASDDANDAEALAARLSAAVEKHAEAAAALAVAEQQKIRERLQAFDAASEADIDLHARGLIGPQELKRRIAMLANEHFAPPVDPAADIAAMQAATQLLVAEQAAKNAGVVDTTRQKLREDLERAASAAAQLAEAIRALRDLG
jgi:hypothetical protein